MLDLVQALNKDLSVAKTEILKFCKDKEIPVQERWAVAVEGSWAFPHELDAVMVEFTPLLGTKVLWYLDFTVERYRCQDLLCGDFARELTEASEDISSRFMQVTLEEVQEYILQLGIRSFVNDW
jgi:hypothetical protein